MGLQEDFVDLFEIDNFGVVADGLDEGGDDEVAGSAQEAFGGADDEGESVLGEGIVTEAGPIELIEDKPLDGFGREARQECRVSDPGSDFLVDGQGQGLEEGGLGDEHEIM